MSRDIPVSDVPRDHIALSAGKRAEIARALISGFERKLLVV